MNVQSISLATPQHNSQPTFNGYVDKPVIKLVRGLTQMGMDRVVNEANLSCQKVDIRKLHDVRTMGEAILAKFNHFVENLHPKTILTFDDSRSRLVVKNKELGTDVPFSSYKDVTNNTGRLDTCYHRIDAYAPGLVGLSGEHLKAFNNLADTLVKAPRKEEIDGYLFKEFTRDIERQADNSSFFAGLKTKRNGKKADKLAPEFGQPTGWKEKLAEIRNEAIARTEKIKRIYKAHLETNKENIKIAKNILNED